MEVTEKNRKIKEFVIVELLFGTLLFLRYYDLQHLFSWLCLFL